MKRIDKVELKLIELFKKNENGITASELSESLEVDRTNVSRDLNTLVKLGRIKKKKTKPVLFEPIEIVNRNNNFGTTKLDFFGRANPSMYTVVEQGKAAILYPPNGMNMLFLGDTGVGKSMMAELIYNYGIEIRKFKKDAPFIQFNCADYANNPQLLVSQIFGHKKGAYTGAENDKSGLIEQANEGILFLDEVHRLPPEGQEMLFTYIDRGIFRRLGETDKIREAKVLIIAATTEDPRSSLLKTFTRRIPMVINIPNLESRTLEERFSLINLFLTNESQRLKNAIKVSVNSIRAFLSYRCENNIGQLKADVQIVCAKAYADYLTRKKQHIIITTTDLPDYILNGLYSQVEHRKIWTNLNNIKERFFEYNAESNDIDFEYPKPGETIYDMIDKKFNALDQKNIDMSEFEKEIGEEIDNYFTQFVTNTNSKENKLEAIIPESIIKTVDNIIEYCEKRLNKKLNEKIYYAFAIHISNTINRVKLGMPINNPKLEQIKEQYSQQFTIAKECIEILNTSFDTNIPDDEAGFITLFLVNDQVDNINYDGKTRVIVIAHGKGIATALVDTVNELLNCEYAIGINAHLDEKPKEVLERLKEVLRKDNNKLDTLFLVDMGSLITFSNEIEKELGINTKVIPLVSTLHVLEATRKAMVGYTLEEIYKDVSQLYKYMGIQTELIEENFNLKKSKRKLAILTVCLTGEGTAKTIKRILENHLTFDNKHLEIIPVNIVGKESIANRIEKIEEDYKIICVISSFDINTDIKQFNLYSVLNLKSISEIQSLVTDATTYSELGNIIKENINIPNVDMMCLIDDIIAFNYEMEKILNVRYDINVLLGFSLHLCGVIERIRSGREKIPFIDEGRDIINNTVVIKKTQMLVERFFSKYIKNIEIDNIYYIAKMYIRQMKKS